MGINFYDVREGISSLKGEGITRSILWPGAGVGGHCLTKDTYHLERGVTTAGIELLDYPKGKDSLYVLARTINDFMPSHVVTLLTKGLSRAGKSLNGAKIVLLGWSFLANTDDSRNTPAELVWNLCIRSGAEVRVHDPWVQEYPGVDIISDLLEAIKGVDAIIICTGHREYYSLIPSEILSYVSTSPVIVDGRNVIDPDMFIEKGYIYLGIGRGDKNHHSIIS
jgi:UDP-N-acetyl-D-mannosaminuronic acid dehydrogenase